MTPSYMKSPRLQITITHTGEDFVFASEDHISVEVTRRENGWDHATVVMADTQSRNWNTRIAKGDSIQIEVKDQSDATWTTILNGIITVAMPAFSEGTNVISLKCDGSGYPLDRMKCGQEYGSQSTNPTLDTLQEILTDNTDGVFDKWLVKVLGSATDSGYSFTDEVENIVGVIKYVYFPYKPVDKCVNDVCELVQAIKGVAAGPHWIVTTGDKIIVSTVASHHATAETAGWTTYYGGSLLDSTVEEIVDFPTFAGTELTKEANYILYHGRLRKPASEIWTEGNAANWARTEVLATGDSACTDDTDAGDFLVGIQSVNCLSESGVGGGTLFTYPSVAGLNLDVTKIGGEYSIPTISFYARVDGNVTLAAGSTPLFLMGTGAVNSVDYYIYTLGGHLQASKWARVVLPVGPHAKRYPYSGTDEVANLVNAGDWTDVDWVAFGITNSGAPAGTIHIDGLNINGHVLRVAKQAAAYSATDPCLMKVITDDEGKDDTLLASDDSGTIARLAYAEYLRCSTTPLVAMFTTPMIKDLLPGQLLHTHAKKKADASFTVDKDMRVTKLVHTINKDVWLTTPYVTDDVKNSHARTAYNDLNLVLKAARPEFQDRQATSIKMRDIDITLPVLEKTY